MTEQTISVTRTISAAPDSVWRLLADVGTWAQWGAFDASELESPGAETPEGVGAIRRFQRGRWTTREQVTAFEPGRRLGYEVVSGIPVKEYAAEVLLTEADGATVLHWESRFRAKYPGTGGTMRRQLAGFIEALVTALQTAVESQKDRGRLV